MNVFDIVYEIFHRCNFSSKLNLLATCRLFYDQLFLTNLVMIPVSKLRLLTDEILSQKKFSRLTELQILPRARIKHIPTSLKTLILYGNNIGQEEIKRLDLQKIVLYNNRNINDISFMKNLRIVTIRDRRCSLTQDSISGFQ